MKRQAGQLGLQEKIVFHGFCSRVAEETKDAAMFVLCSNYEGISNSLVEALAMGIPTIATDCPVGGCKSYISDHVNGILIPVGDGEALTEAMKEIAGNEKLAASLSAEAAKVRERFSVERIARAMLEALEERVN